MIIPEHDAKPGPLKYCQISGSDNLNPVIDLGIQPLCDAILSKEQLDQPEKKYPLKLMHCPDSGLAQLSHVVDGGEVYPPSYPYRSGISKPLEEYQRAFADDVVKTYGAGLTVDIGCNDGTLLTGFRRNGCQVIGVEPTDIAKIAKKEGLPVIQEFFTESLAVAMVKDDGHAKFVTMTNVFAHMAPLGEVMRGVCELIGNDGIFITESHYLLDVLEKTQFDTVYHEHIRTYSLKSLCILAAMYGLEVFHVERRERYGGNIRAYIGKRHQHRVMFSVAELLNEEDRKKLHRPQTWVDFAKRVDVQKNAFMESLHKAKKNGLRTAGCSAPGRCATLLNYYGVTPDLLPYLCELHNSLKLDKYLPGCHIPIVNNERLAREQPDIIYLMAWHYQEPIVKRLRAEGITAKLYVPLPEFSECS